MLTIQNRFLIHPLLISKKVILRKAIWTRNETWKIHYHITMAHSLLIRQDYTYFVQNVITVVSILSYMFYVLLQHRNNIKQYKIKATVALIHNEFVRREQNWQSETLCARQNILRMRKKVQRMRQNVLRMRQSFPRLLFQSVANCQFCSHRTQIVARSRTNVICFDI